jgi:hypothetical protein
MTLAYNAERGEVPLTVGGVELVIAAEMGRLAALSTRLACQGFMELYLKLAKAEINAVVAAVELLSIKGDVGKAIKEMTLADLPACTEAFMKTFTHHADKVSGNAEAVKGPQTTESPGGSGKDSPQ